MKSSAEALTFGEIMSASTATRGGLRCLSMFMTIRPIGPSTISAAITHKAQRTTEPSSTSAVNIGTLTHLLRSRLSTGAANTYTRIPRHRRQSSISVKKPPDPRPSFLFDEGRHTITMPKEHGASATQKPAHSFSRIKYATQPRPGSQLSPQSPIPLASIRAKIATSRLPKKKSCSFASCLAKGGQLHAFGE
jgi:hypothetical protein